MEKKLTLVNIVASSIAYVFRWSIEFYSPYNPNIFIATVTWSNMAC